MLKNKPGSGGPEESASGGTSLPPINQSSISSNTKNNTANAKQSNANNLAFMLGRLEKGPLSPAIPSPGNNLKRQAVAPALPFQGLKSRRKFGSSNSNPSIGDSSTNITDNNNKPAEKDQIGLAIESATTPKLPQSVAKIISAKKKQAELETLSPLTPKPTEKRVVPLSQLPSDDPFDFIERVTGKGSNGKVNDAEFVYMMPVKQENGSYNPYHLKIVDYQFIDRGNFFTLSYKGVTHFINGMASFTQLDLWQREYKLFNIIVKIPFFAKYRIWKCYSAWRKYVRSKKLNAAKKHLSEHLFVLNSNLRASLFKVRSICQDFKTKRFHNLKSDQTYDLAPLIKDHENCLKEVLHGFSGFRHGVEGVVIDGCESFLVKSGFEPIYSKKNAPEETVENSAKLGSLHPMAAAANSSSIHNFGSNNSGRKNLGSASTNTSVPANALKKMTFTEMAARRKACLKLQRFVKLADYLIIGALHNVSIISLNDLLSYLFHLNTDSDVEMEASDIDHLPMSDVKTSELVALLNREAFHAKLNNEKKKLVELDGSISTATNTDGIPLLRSELKLDGSTILFTPSREEFVSSMEKISKSFVNVVESFPLLASTVVYIEKKDLLDEATFSDGPNIFQIVIEDPFYQVLYSRIKGTVVGNFGKCYEFSKSFQMYIQMYTENLEITMESLKASDLSLGYFESALAKYASQKKQMEEIQIHKQVGNILVDSSVLQKVLLPSPIRCFGYLETLLPTMVHLKNESLLNELNQSIRILRSNPSSVEGFVDNLHHLDTVKGDIGVIEERVDEIIKLYNLVENYNISVAPTELALYQTLVPTVRQLKDVLEICEDTREESIQKFTVELEKNIAEMLTEVNDIRNRSQDPMILNPGSSADSVKRFIEDLHSSLKKQQVLSENYISYQKVFKIPASKFTELEETMNDLNLKMSLWTSFEEWDSLVKTWKSLPFDKLDTEELNTKILSYLKIVVQLEKGLPPNEVVPKLRSTVEEFRQIYPTIVDLRNQSLKARHWDRIQDVIGKVVVKDESFTLGKLQELNVFQYKDDISTISAQASSESALEEMLAKVTKSWAELEFTILPYRDYKDVFILGGVDEIGTILEDSQVAIATIRGSRFMAPIKNEVEKWDKQLSLFSETLDEWITCQRNWLYLESIFSAPDIQRQLPDESKMFSQVDRSWKDIMRKTARNPLAIKAGTTPGFLESLQQNNQLLEKIQKCLEEYLESKRLLFPRFYFLSNDELLEILAQTRNPLAVQPHLGKCFDAIKTLEFSNEPKSIDILAMMSPEGERLAFSKVIKARGNVETWLSTVEEGMYGTVRRSIKAALADFDRVPREEWILGQPGQTVLAVSQLMWCREVIECLKAKQPVAALQKFKEKSVSNLSKLAAMVRGKLSKLNRGKLGALITIEVHARDIVIGLIAAKASGPNDFEWLKQLRYYWDPENDSCLVRQTTSVFEYGYEYLGCSPRLVITPLTDRCYLTLTSAISLNLGGNPLGPAGTGKTETVKDLAKAVARQCVVFNCSDQLDYKMMGKFFAGLAQSGAWCCFDEFNRIDIEVLSVIAQQLLTIKRAKDSKVSRFLFEGKDIRLITTCAAFITMNPGYAGRTELPDNLKALFRPIAMMIPDYALIAEIILFSEGFENAKVLSRKLVNLYKLCSEQLSQQDHYDFGMRAVKSSVTMAGSLKRASPDLSEDVALIRSLRDSNLPKFLADDIPLFKGILGDLFPGVDVPPLDYGDLLKAIHSIMHEKNLHLVEPFVDRIIQLYETMKVRHGVMLVGPSGAGKTTNYEVLAGALTQLRERGHSNVDYQKVKTFVLNPKCITMAELYGEFNLATMEWRDGLIGNIIRAQVQDTSNDEKWVVCDGPVDALWIENMNTVLDDNKLLCLSNGERIKLNNTIHMMFEVADLAVASPATVSRCGMVYLDPLLLGWIPFVKKWLKELPKHVSEEQKELLFSMFETFVDPGIKFIRKNCKEFIPSVNINLISSLCRIVQTFLMNNNPETGIDFSQSVAEIKTLFATIFAFSYIWSIGGNLSDGHQDQFDTFIRENFDNNLASDFSVPSGGNNTSVYSFRVNIQKKKLTPWEELMPTFNYNPSLPFFEILVPTIDTVRYSYLVESLFNIDAHVLISGTTGVGKSFIIQDCINQMAKKRTILQSNINFSAQTTSAMTQQILELKLEKKRKNLLGAPNNSKIVMFVDDLNMPKLDTYGAQPPIELLRQYLDFGGVYDLEKLFWKKIQDVVVLAACAPPGGGRNAMTQRLTRHFNLLSIPTPLESSQVRIFKSIVDGFLQTFESEVQSCVDAIVNSSVEIFKRMCIELLPTPAKSHYTFNMRDLSKVVQGITQARPSIIVQKAQMARLFAHESSRVFHDRLINNSDRQYFNTILAELVEKNFGVSLVGERKTDGAEDAKNVVNNPIIFGDFMKRGVSVEDRQYEEIKDMKNLEHILEDYLEEFNTLSSKQMRLIFFMDARQHLSRISRIIRQPRGNGLLVGVGGTGKQSLTRLACHVSEYRCVQIELTRTYGINEWREDIKRLYRYAGLEGKPTVFLLSDTQIKSDVFLEDINSILNTGEIPSLFDFEERERILGELRGKAREAGYPEDRDSVQQFFINRVRDNLHIILATSPVGDTFRNRCRMFPSLVNCCTIDWFDEWPREALLSVSSRFLEFVDLGDAPAKTNEEKQQDVDSADPLKERISKMCVEIHTSVSLMAGKFYQELRRRYYTTPTSYLELINLYVGMLQEKRKELVTSRDRLKNGLDKLYETNEVVARMQVELESLKPELKSKAEDVEILIAQISKDQETADGVRKVVREEEAVVKEKAVLTEQIAAEAQKDLDEALPALEAAYKALDSLDKKDVAEMKAFSKPPEMVMTVMEAICILFKAKPDWDSSKKLLSDSQFLKNMVNFDKDNVSEATTKKLRKYIDNPSFTPDQVEKVSKAAKSMCMWVRAIDLYARVFKDVQPKRKKLEDAQTALEEMKAKLQEKAKALADVENQLKNLRLKYDSSVASKKLLQDKMAETSKRLARASKLTTALADEQDRWTESVKSYEIQINDVVGNIFLAAAGIAYFGAFTSQYREELVSFWISKCQELGIPVSDNFNLTRVLGDNVVIREWGTKGLPSDNLSVENGILVTRGRRWPLMIDPQGQANRWIKNLESGNGLKIIKLSEPKFLRTLENAIRLGNPVLLEDVGETLDPALEPLLLKQTYKQGGRVLIRIGDADVDYDKNFRFYMTSKMANPHYLPEICIKVTIINFTVTGVGLTGQLLGDVVRLERPDLEEQRNHLIISMAEDKRQLKEIEDKILKLLYNSQGNILDDEQLIDALNQSKVTSGAIQERVKASEQTEADINAAREKYLPVAIRGSILYFCIADLAEIDPMYQFSLKYFKNIFNGCITSTVKVENLSDHIQNLCDRITSIIFRNVSRGLFEQHKLTFSFLICVQILRDIGSITPLDWNFFLRGCTTQGGSSTSETADKNASASARPRPLGVAWLTESKWKTINDIATNPSSPFAEIFGANFLDIFNSVNNSGKSTGTGFSNSADFLKFENFMTCSTDQAYTKAANLPSFLTEKMSKFHRLCLTRILREEAVTSACIDFIRDNLGKSYVDPIPFDLSKTFEDTSVASPLIFVLSTGSDPASALLKYAKEVGYTEKLSMISLGQGQGPIAEELIKKAGNAGDWVFLQNCHLAASWMPRLENIVKEISSPDANDGVKVTNEPPKGLRANLVRFFSDLSPETYQSGMPNAPIKGAPAVTAFKKLLFGISFFNGLIHERKKFGPLGWNISYDWSNSDLEVAVAVLGNTISDCVTNANSGETGNTSSNNMLPIPWDSLTYMTGEIIFGGRVTDDWDRRTLRSMLGKFYTQKILDPEYKLCPGLSQYYAPGDATFSLATVRNYIDGLPLTESPEVFGMHQNANITFQMQETTRLLQNIIDVQPRVAAGGGSGGKTSEETVQEMAQSLLAGLPAPLNMEEISPERYKTDSEGRVANCLETVLIHEAARFNKLLRVIKLSLETLIKAIKGLVVMSADLDLVFGSLLNGQVPVAWANAAYPSLKRLGAWMEDLLNRVKFMREWIEKGQPNSFWISGFFYPQGFLTAILQNHARQNKIAIDELSFGFEVTKYESPEDIDQSEITAGSLFTLVHGLFVEGARWDRKSDSLQDSFDMVMYSKLPLTKFIPKRQYVPDTKLYETPLYKTSARAGTLSTTGQSTNFVLALYLPSNKPSDYWISKGVALLCQLNE